MLRFFKRLKKASKKEEEEFDQMIKENVTPKDKFAMVVSAFFVIVLPCLAVLTLLSLLCLWIFRVL